MPLTLPTIALLSPNNAAYSETFIQAHKKHLKGTIKYYYGGPCPTLLEGHGKTCSNIRAGFYYFKHKFFNHRFTHAQQALKKSFKKEKIDIVLAEYGITGANCYKICHELKIPLIVHFHGFDAHRNDIIEEYLPRYKKMFDLAAKVIIVSDPMKKKLISMGCPANKMILNPCGTNDLFLKRKNKTTGKKIASVGRFVDKKAPYLTLAAFKQVLEKHPDAKLIMVGDGPLLTTCKNLSIHWRIDHAVTFLGAVPHEQVKRLYTEALIFVQHSITADNGDSEGSPVSITEAGAAGLPIVSTNHANIPNLVIHEKTGFLVEEKDVDGMAQAIIKLTDDIELAKKMGAAGREHIRAHFSMDKHIGILNELVRETCI